MILVRNIQIKSWKNIKQEISRAPIMSSFVIIQTYDYVFPALEPRFSPFWSLQLNIQLVVLFRQPVIISFRGKTFCNILIDQGGRESRCSEEIVNGKK